MMIRDYHSWLRTLTVEEISAQIPIYISYFLSSFVDYYFDFFHNRNLQREEAPYNSNLQTFLDSKEPHQTWEPLMGNHVSLNRPLIYSEVNKPHLQRRIYSESELIHVSLIKHLVLQFSWSKETFPCPDFKNKLHIFTTDDDDAAITRRDHNVTILSHTASQNIRAFHLVCLMCVCIYLHSIISSLLRFRLLLLLSFSALPA